MKTLILAAMLAIAGLAGAQEHVMSDDEALHDPEGTSAPATLSRSKRSVAPIVSMPCEDGFKPIGDDCVPVNIEFE